MEKLTFFFLLLNFLAATQDIAVDGWALSMLHPENINWASTCNTVGQTAGFFFGNVVFLALESLDFSNNYVRYYLGIESGDIPIMSFERFLYINGIIFIVSTTLVWMLKHETPDHTLDEDTIVGTYSKLLSVLKLKSIQTYLIILITAKVAFACTDGVTMLKLIDFGVSKEKLAMLAVPLTPVQIMLPLVLSRFTNPTRPMDLFVKAYHYRLMFGIVLAIFVWYTRYMLEFWSHFYFYSLLVVIFLFHQVSVCANFTSQMSFHARVSDPSIGGSYMTLLNTVANLAGNWPVTAVLFIVDYVTVKGGCTVMTSNSDNPTLNRNLCINQEEVQACHNMGGKCEPSFDGYYSATLICTLCGAAWLFFASRRLVHLQSLPKSGWKIG